MEDLSKLKFFLVDDDSEILHILTTILEGAGHEVSSSTSSVDAIDKIQAFKPHCVIVDLMMPEKDGLQICKEIRDNPESSDINIIVVSAKPYEFDRRRAYEFGADGYITKPVDVKTFVSQVERILKNTIELTFWGVRGTLPVPGEKSLRYGGNTSCVTLEFAKQHFFIFDAGTGIKNLGDHLVAEKRLPIAAKVFISHPHWDHINAFPFFTPLFVPGNEFEVCGASHGDVTVREIISAQMDGIYFPITIKEFGARVFFRNLREEAFTIDDIVVKTMLLNHPGYCLGYRVEYNGRSVCYITDNELYLEDNQFYNQNYVQRLKRFIEGTDALITDSTYRDSEYTSKVGWGHSSLGQVVNLAHEANVKTLYLFHHDPDQSDDDIDAKLATAESMLKDLGSSTKVLAPAERQTFEL